MADPTDPTDPVCLELRQLALDVAAAAGTIYDALEAHGTEAPWAEDGAPTVLALLELHRKTDVLTRFFHHQARRRLTAMGIDPRRAP